ncbi:MAG TPA: shikimate dehydrogenase [Acidimicrobiales bacterium]
MAERPRPPITGATRAAAVIGWPARHSLSPTILNAAFAAAGLDWVYLAFEVPDGRAADAVAAMRTLGLAGLSVTMPHKAAVHDAVDERTPVAADLGAVNCVFWRGDRLVGDNTDGDGFLDALRTDHGLDVAGRRCVVVGAGGAGRAVARALGAAGAADVAVVNRSPEPAARAAALAGPRGRIGTPADVGAAGVVVNATPLGMAGAGGAGGEATGRMPVDPAALHAGQVVVDLIYHPEVTPLLAEARDRGAVAVNGLGMLVHQAARAFHRWTGDEPPVAAMDAAARRELARRAQVDVPS